jgi:hypothetical protein
MNDAIAERLELVFRVREVLSLSLWPKIDYPYWDFVIFIILSKQMRDNKSGHDRSFPDPFLLNN